MLKTAIIYLMSGFMSYAIASDSPKFNPKFKEIKFTREEMALFFEITEKGNSFTVKSITGKEAKHFEYESQDRALQIRCVVRVGDEDKKRCYIELDWIRMTKETSWKYEFYYDQMIRIILKNPIDIEFFRKLKTVENADYQYISEETTYLSKEDGSRERTPIISIDCSQDKQCSILLAIQR